MSELIPSIFLGFLAALPFLIGVAIFSHLIEKHFPKGAEPMSDEKKEYCIKCKKMLAKNRKYKYVHDDCQGEHYTEADYQTHMRLR